jgi:excisionase family DNA binding protein
MGKAKSKPRNRAKRSGVVSSVDGRAVLTVAEVAQLLGIGRISAYQAVERGEVPSIRLGRRIVVPKAAFCAKFGNSG